MIAGKNKDVTPGRERMKKTQIGRNKKERTKLSGTERQRARENRKGYL